MPYARKYTKRGKRRTRKKRSSALAKFRRFGTPVPAQMHTTLRYVDDFALNALNGQAVHVFYNANNVYDPQNAIGGHQPMGWDQLNVFYESAYVYGSKITCTFSMANPGSTLGQAICGIRNTEDTTAIGSVPQMRENTQNLWRLLDADSPVTISKTFNYKRQLRKPYINDENRCAIGTGPTINSVYDIWVGALNATLDPDAVNINMTIEYYVTFTERNALAQS